MTTVFIPHGRMPKVRNEGTISRACQKAWREAQHVIELLPERTRTAIQPCNNTPYGVRTASLQALNDAELELARREAIKSGLVRDWGVFLPSDEQNALVTRLELGERMDREHRAALIRALRELNRLERDAERTSDMRRQFVHR